MADAAQRKPDETRPLSSPFDRLDIHIGKRGSELQSRTPRQRIFSLPTVSGCEGGDTGSGALNIIDFGSRRPSLFDAPSSFDFNADAASSKTRSSSPSTRLLFDFDTSRRTPFDARQDFSFSSAHLRVNAQSPYFGLKSQPPQGNENTTQVRFGDSTEKRAFSFSSPPPGSSRRTTSVFAEAEHSKSEIAAQRGTFTQLQPMVREREPQPSQPTVGAAVMTMIGGRGATDAQSKRNQTNVQQASSGPSPDQSNNKILYDLTSSSPEFGKSSPLRNPLKSHDHLFIPRSGARVEHHSQPSRAPGAAFNAPKSLAPQPQYSASFVSPGQRSFEPPTNPNASQTFHAMPDHRPAFSTMNPPGGFQPVNPYAASRPAVDLTNDDEDEEDSFDPNAALENLSFGEKDPFMYVDGDQANKDMKALLEGAFDEEAPKLKLRKRKQPENKLQTGSKGLASKLAALDVKNETKAEADGEDEEVNDGSIDGLKVKLLPHQVEGLAWMTDKEVGQRKRGSPLPMGGILADDMGLGKTLQSMALILTNPRPSDAEIEEANKKIRLKRQKMSLKMGKGTLVVAPLALIRQWESEIKTKVSSSHSLKVLVHHGTSRTKLASELKKYDVVITTYQIVASEHASSSDAPDGPKIGCFGVQWYRIILDEAHTVKNRNAKSTKACYALRSHFRWCLTGTPMQNNLEELQSLIAFLRIKPYCDLGNWKQQITAPMKNGRGGLAMKRLQFFLKACMKRRTKDILKEDGALDPGGKLGKRGDDSTNLGFKMVERKVESVVVEFNAKERSFYDNLSARAQNSLEDMMLQDKINHIGALVLLLRLRQACNHPRLISASTKKDKDALEGGRPGGNSGPQTPRKNRSGDDDADDLADLLGGLTVTSKKCDSCGSKLEPHEARRGSLQCDACEHDKDMFEDAFDVVEGLGRKLKGKKKKKKSKKAEDESEAAAPETKLKRRRAVVTDSDDEDEGEWIVPDGQRGATNLGQAGGTDDEDAEGGGDTLGSADSASESEEDEEEEDSEESEAEDSSDSDSTDDPKSSYRDKYINNPFASTKIRHLLRILDAETPSHKVIVFSQFTSMLDLIEPFLRNAGFVFTRYDGSMRNDDREHSLNRLRTDDQTRVLLCSLKCGSLGLNLTAASRVVILEPFWNPFVEEQAIDRVHRLNQTVDVHVYKITIADSVEERILELQESKRKLAAAAIEQGGAKGLNKLSMQDIMNLFKRDAELQHEKSAEDDFLGKHGRVLATGWKEDHELKGGMPRGMGEYNDWEVRKASRRAPDPVYGLR